MERNLVWEECEAQKWQTPFNVMHTQYRGFDVHNWRDFFCFYPLEGDASKKEMFELCKRIEDANLEKYLYRMGNARNHAWRYQTSVCSLKQRRDGETKNYCLEVQNLDDLDHIIDGLYAESGLSVIPSKIGRWR